MKLSQSGLLIWDVEFLKIKTKNWLNEPSQNIQTQTSHHDLIPTERISKQRNDELSLKSEREPAWTSRPQSPTESSNKSNTSLILPPNVLQKPEVRGHTCSSTFTTLKTSSAEQNPAPPVDRTSAPLSVLFPTGAERSRAAETLTYWTWRGGGRRRRGGDTANS